MGFVEAVRSCLRQYVGFRGRARRSEYWWFVLAVFLAGAVASLLDALLFGTGGSAGFESATAPPPDDGYAAAAWATAEQGPVASLTGLLTFLPSLSVAVRRLHDTDRSAWYILAPLAITLAGLVLAGLAAALSGTLAATIWVVAILATIFLPLWWFIQKGTRGPNRFGPDPLEVVQ